MENNSKTVKNIPRRVHQSTFVVLKYEIRPIKYHGYFITCDQHHET
jgi:hypothetical protein